MTAPKEIFVDWEYNEDKPYVTINDENALPDENDVKHILATHATSPEYLSTLPAEVLEKAGLCKNVFLKSIFEEWEAGKIQVNNMGPESDIVETLRLFNLIELALNK
jgi:hypothetical protein